MIRAAPRNDRAFFPRRKIPRGERMKETEEEKEKNKEEEKNKKEEEEEDRSFP